MHDQAIYWLLLTERHPAIGAVPSPEAGDAALAGILEEWLGRGNRSLHDLFALHPEPLAASMSVSGESLAPLLALRARLPRMERSLAQLSKAGVDILPLWDRRCPRPLRAALEGQPPLLWYAGNLALLEGKAVAVAGARESSSGAVLFARDLSAALALEGRTLLTGLTRAVERAALEGALGSAGGVAVAVLGQGIGRSLPELQRLHAPLREGRLLVLSPLHPDAFWQPRLEQMRSACLAALAERLIVIEPADDAGVRHLARLALEAGRPVLQYVAGEIDPPGDLLDGAQPVVWPAEGRSLAQLVLSVPRTRVREPRARLEEAPSSRAARRRAEGAVVPGDAAPDQTFSLPEDPRGDQHIVLEALRRKRGALGKGALLQQLGVSEPDLDRALAALISGGLVEERSSRSGAGYAAVRQKDGSADRGFQLSLFGVPPE